MAEPLRRSKPRKNASKASGATTASPGRRAKPVLLSGGNPQIAKGDGDGPVQAYIAAMPGWKRDVGRRLDVLITRIVPDVRKAVKWNSPFYGLDGRGWILALHVFTRFVRITFFHGAHLKPVPPVTSKVPNVAYFDVHEHDDVNAQQLTAWVKQATRLPGWGKISP
jgi:hypothetical protein